MSRLEGELPCPNSGCGGWLRVEVIEDDPWHGARRQAVLEQDDCTCDPDQLTEDYDLGRELHDFAEPDPYGDFDRHDTTPEQDIPF